jgi:rubrerythrin
MAGIFKANEVVTAAVEVEKKGETFYRRLADSAKNVEVREGFEYLAGEEVKHREIFQSILDRLGPIELPPWSQEEEYNAYLHALIDTHFLSGGDWSEQLLSRISSEREAIMLAMTFEKDSILFFTEMKGLVPEGEKSIVVQCIDEEKGHLIKLKGMLG